MSGGKVHQKIADTMQPRPKIACSQQRKSFLPLPLYDLWLLLALNFTFAIAITSTIVSSLQSYIQLLPLLHTIAPLPPVLSRPPKLTPPYRHNHQHHKLILAIRDCQ